MDGAFEAADHLLEGLEVNLSGICLSGAKDAQCCGDVWARADSRILEAAQEAGIDVLHHACEERRVEARKAGHEPGVHREWRGFPIRYAVLV
jgi:imidazolonepropionase-like amidohydrolase